MSLQLCFVASDSVIMLLYIFHKNDTIIMTLNSFYYIANCGRPPVNMNDSITIIGYTQHMPVMEGISVNFSCNLGHILHGPNSSTCVRNGEWEPDPMEVECRGKYTMS